MSCQARVRRRLIAMAAFALHHESLPLVDLDVVAVLVLDVQVSGDKDAADATVRAAGALEQRGHAHFGISTMTVGSRGRKSKMKVTSTALNA